MTKPRIAVIGTGGTIASSGASTTEARSYSVAFTVEELLSAVPALSEIAEITFEQALNIDSSQIENEDVLAIARAVQAQLDDPTIDGVVVTHGTDTMEETAYFLSLVLSTDKPVVMTGAMRPATALSADGPMNLFDSVVTAAHKAHAALGVVVVMAGTILGAREVMKGDCGALAALDGGKNGALGEVAGREVILTQQPMKRGAAFDLSLLNHLSQVDILFDHQSAGAWLAKASVNAGARAIVLAGTGNGSLSKGMKEGAAFAKANGCHVIRSSRVGRGYVSPADVDAEMGLICAGSLSPQKARILAMLTLAQSKLTLAEAFARF